ncbi:MBL fold metallo-hydrolase [Streptomyces sp. GbtcB7]|uniref:MBL fold metallo-hydrolase n=1 Tax=Streptomyces sp. GbtcB7 TaxID=2824752 RepID=UPI001C2F3981|nr:MBL fold metallo-hydrolase [Streptomyces sp. GbtcB7]
MQVTGVEQRNAWRARTQPPVEEVRAGVWSVPVPIPDSPLRYTLCYLLTGDTGLLVVDPGWESDEGWDALVKGMKEAGAGPEDVTGILATHVHPDHHGLSARLREASDAWVGMHPAERDSLPARVWQSAGASEGDRVWLSKAGVPADVAAELAMSREGIARFFGMPEPDLLLEGGDAVPLPGRRLTTVWTPGHTPGHVCLYDADEDILLTGDHVLPRISPNIGLASSSPASPLADYLRSLEQTARYDSAEALPAHEYRFRGLASRTAALHGHHEERCTEIVDALAELGTATAWQLTERLTWSRGWDALQGRLRRFALDETLAHLVLLVDRGRLTRQQASADGPVLYGPGAESLSGGR